MKKQTETEVGLHVRQDEHFAVGVVINVGKAPVPFVTSQGAGISSSFYPGQAATQSLLSVKALKNTNVSHLNKLQMTAVSQPFPH